MKENQSFPNISININQSFGDGIFSFRTRVQIIMKPDGRQGLIFQNKNVINGSDVQNLRNLVDENGLYQIKLWAESETPSPVLTSIPVV